jgi:hypothetical protein
MRRVVAWWLAGSALGAGIVALPDDDDRVLSLSATHGPSAVDLVGTLVLVAAWLPVPATLWRRRDRVPRRTWLAASALLVVGVVWLVTTIGLDAGWWWLPAVALLVAAQVLLLAAAGRPGRSA